MDKTVYIVHAIDTEGPLYESIDATFERLRDTFNINIETNYENLRKLQRKELDIGDKKDAVAEFLNPDLLRYNDSWEKIDAMLEHIMDEKFRKMVPDSDGNGWVYNWHCLDHVGYEINPRRRDIGYHNVHDRYLEFIDKYAAKQDAIHWHFHPMSTYKEAHRCATSYENSPHFHQALCRRIIERNFFPAVYRAGFQAERPDSHWLLEQWIPFDCSNMAIDDPSEFDNYSDFKNGRSGDWRRAPADWRVYQPSHDDYQREGSCRRYIARFLNIGTRIANIDQAEVDKAFERASTGKPTLLGIANHDFRDMRQEITEIMEYLVHSSKKYPDVKFQYTEAVEAFNAVCHEGKSEELEFDVAFFKEDGLFQIKVTVIRGKIFGPQPYLAIKLKGGRFIHDNFDFGADGKSWYYAFYYDTINIEDVEVVGIAANNQYGKQCIKTLHISELVGE